MDGAFDRVGSAERKRDILIAIVARIVPGEVIGSGFWERTLPRYVWRKALLPDARRLCAGPKQKAGQTRGS
jgi:hypothetical protein